jgi:hypothetical protein
MRHVRLANWPVRPLRTPAWPPLLRTHPPPDSTPPPPPCCPAHPCLLCDPAAAVPGQAACRHACASPQGVGGLCKEGARGRRPPRRQPAAVTNEAPSHRQHPRPQATVPPAWVGPSYTRVHLLIQPNHVIIGPLPFPPTSTPHPGRAAQPGGAVEQLIQVGLSKSSAATAQWKADGARAGPPRPTDFPKQMDGVSARHPARRRLLLDCCLLPPSAWPAGAREQAALSTRRHASPARPGPSPDAPCPPPRAPWQAPEHSQ